LPILAEIWGVEPDEARGIAERLVDVGFFQRTGDKNDPNYWTPFLYRDALDLVQGAGRL
jgi:hypothetical protein